MIPNHFIDTKSVISIFKIFLLKCAY